jgi:uncharacterized protein YbaR (Trm112 family)
MSSNKVDNQNSNGVLGNKIVALTTISHISSPDPFVSEHLDAAIDLGETFIRNFQGEALLLDGARVEAVYDDEDWKPYAYPDWNIRAGDMVSFPADQAVCPECKQPLVRVSRVGKPRPVPHSRDRSITITLHQNELHCPNDGCDTDLVLLSKGEQA